MPDRSDTYLRVKAAGMRIETEAIIEDLATGSGQYSLNLWRETKRPDMSAGRFGIVRWPRKAAKH